MFTMYTMPTFPGMRFVADAFETTNVRLFAVPMRKAASARRQDMASASTHG
jgi:hypothetical protein